MYQTFYMTFRAANMFQKKRCYVKQSEYLSCIFVRFWTLTKHQPPTHLKMLGEKTWIAPDTKFSFSKNTSNEVSRTRRFTQVFVNPSVADIFYSRVCVFSFFAIMGDVEVHSNFTVTEKKTKKVKKTTKRRESGDQGTEVINEVRNGNQGYVLAFLETTEDNTSPTDIYNFSY